MLPVCGIFFLLSKHLLIGKSVQRSVMRRLPEICLSDEASEAVMRRLPERQLEIQARKKNVLLTKKKLQAR